MRNLILASLLGLIGLFMIAAGDVQAAPPSPTQQQQQPLLGDVNCDHRVDAVDALAILRLSAKIQQSEDCSALADVNCDHQLNAIDALAILRFAAGNRDNNPCGPGKVMAAPLKLPLGQTRVDLKVDTPEGPERQTLAEKPQAQGTAVVAGSYPRTCSYTIWNQVSSYLYGATLTSTFWYDYSSVYQNQPYVGTWNVWPYSWHDKSAWNSYWSETVRFADGIADLHSDFPWPGFVSVTKHIYIGEDAWGNCWGSWYNG